MGRGGGKMEEGEGKMEEGRGKMGRGRGRWGGGGEYGGGEGEDGEGQEEGAEVQEGRPDLPAQPRPQGHPLELLPSQPSTRPSTGHPGGKGHYSTFSGETQQPNPKSGHPQVASPPSAPCSCRDQTGKSQEQGPGA